MSLIQGVVPCHCQFYLLDESKQAAATLNPRKVPVVAMGEAQQFWPVQRKRSTAIDDVHPGWDLFVHHWSEDEESQSQSSVEDEGPDVGIVEIGPLDGSVLREEAMSYLRDQESLRSLGLEQQQPDAVIDGAEENIAIVSADVVAAVPEEGSGAASSRDVLPKKRARGADASLRDAAECSLEVAGGRLAYYANKGAFEARCNHVGHNLCGQTCKLTRSSKSRKLVGGMPKGGRPLGFMLAWLELGKDLPHKDSHWDRSAWHEHCNVETREACRMELHSTAQGRALLAFERPLHDGEQEEAPDLDGLMH
eukprot:6478289-Amphidinium_carterae.2